jgi:imidazolonepropionase-like amidohydrolase
VRSEDGYWPQDPQIDRARAGGITVMQILPGSANLIGGRAVTVKTYPGARGVDDVRMAGAPDGLKMACGENPKRVYGDKGGPSTRMGNVAGYRAAFQKALEYQRSWDRHRDKLARSKARRGLDKNGKPEDPPDPPARDLGLETLAAVMRGEVLVHNHCYRADEMLGMLALGREFGFSIRSFHHAVEAYKIADRLADAGVAASVWADWWGFKAEAFDGIRENAAMVSAAGARAIIHSDSAIGTQHLNQEAAKAMWAGRRAGLDIPDDEALRWITANAAWALGVLDRVGTLEVGKQADLVVWDGDPFSVYSKAERVFIEGRLVYDRARPAAQPHTDFELGYETGFGGAK